MSQRLHFCKICGKQFATVKAVSGHLRIHSSSGNLHVCKICGKKYATSKSLCRHQEIHSCKSNRMVDENEILCLLRILGLDSVSDSANEISIESEILGFSLSHKESSSSSSLTEIEEHEMNEAATSLVMFSQQVHDFAAIRNLPPPPPTQENILHCVESKLLSHSNSTTCSDVVAHAVPSPLTSKLQRKPESNVSYKCKICGKNFGCSQALGGHHRVHRPIKGQLARKKEDSEGDNLLSDSLESKKIALQLSSFEDTNVKEHCLELKEEFGEMFSHEKSSSCSDVVGQALHSPLRRKLEEKPESNSSRKCGICGKTFGSYQALGGHQRLHRSTSGQVARKGEDIEGGNSLSGLSEAEKIVSEPSSFEVSQGELIELRDTNVKEHCVELKQDFAELGFDKSSSCGDVVAQALLPSLLRCKLQEKPKSNSSRKCKICNKTFECYQALGGHLRLHRSTGGQIAVKRPNSLADSPEAKKIFSQESSFEVCQD